MSEITTTGNVPAKITIKEYIAAPAVQSKMQELLVSPDLIRQFTTSVISISSQDKLLSVADPRSLFNAALTAASMNLPINKNLGFAHIIGYENKKAETVEAQFQMGARGFKELAQRSGRYTKIHEGDVREGEIKKLDRLTGEIEWNWIEDEAEREAKTVIGYFSYFKLDNGFENTVYWSVDKIRKHAERFSQAYKADLKYKSERSPWSTDFAGMAMKTVMKNNISKNGPLDVNLQKAIDVDQGVIKEDGKVEYIDGDEMVQDNPIPQAAIDDINDATSSEQIKDILAQLTVEQQKVAEPIATARLKALKTVKS